MLPQANRLKHRRDFQAVYQKGIRRSGRYFTLRGLRQRRKIPKLAIAVTSQSMVVSQPPTRIGISISQKVSKKAVVRNRIKRQIRGVLRHLLPRILPGWHLAIVVQPRAVTCDYAEFLRELEQLLAEAEVIDGN
ncbi:MAG TPA: ribonuclease P protein component [Cyanobacteria bacterium UBA11149]|nr:ribonuclease P protein component [Cyanobacteria bacterium UBA11367]HBE59442.1 ribonuclease P protein component [Cyanobacteria bacterium UBA11366]HBK65307.1 ribonuclease P protein component [Cyanobacteria bacterium UBA11166]HBR76332.1 ribonuclease P protein component [Cyanobacteria bacterium UBA11159]HBS72451.1 ribonuclease P protein component [Cyanobacteria bacterium UBA11153]HBW89887.1 ribonuclease P protein component [Cyanobacteria bacterium UBA11149]HCA97600.1 ribonuclease P protein com